MDKRTSQERLTAATERIRKAHARLMEARALRDEGKTFQEIGDTMGVTRQRAKQLVDDADRELSAQ